MPLSVFCGPYQPSLENAFVERLTSLRPGPDRPAAVVTASSGLSDRLQVLLARERGLSLLGTRFFTFHTLALEVLEKAGRTDRAVVPDEFFHDKVVDGLIKGGPGRGFSLGLAAAFRSSVRDLMEAGLEPDRFREYFSDLIQDPHDKARFQELLDLQDRYRAALAGAKVLSLPELARAAARALEEGADEGLRPFAEVLYYGFYDLNGVQADFFHAVAASRPAVLFCPTRPGRPAFAFAERFYKAKLHQGGRAPVLLEAPFKDRALGEALDCLFDPARQAALRDKKALRIFSVSGRRDEAWRVAKEILALRAEMPDLSFHDIGVVARSLEPYRAVLADVFRENAVPLAAPPAEPLLKHPLARLSLALLTLRRRNMPAAQLLDVAESPYFRRERFRGVSRGDRLTAQWRRLLERLDVHSGWWQWTGKVAPWAKKDFEPFLREDEGRDARPIPRQDTAALWDFARDLYARLDPAREAGRWAAAAEEAAEILRENFDAPAEGPEARVWERTLEAVEGLKIFDRLSSRVSWGEFLEALEEKLQGETLEPGPPREGVRLLNAMEARGQSFRVLFLMGLQEGLFPRQVREDPLLRDSVRNLLQDAAGYWILPKLAGYEEEKLLFALTVSAATERLHCLYPRSDEEGKAQVPSIYLRELCRACGLDFEKEAGERVPRQPLARLQSVPPALLTPKEASLLAAAAEQDPSPLWEALGTDAAWLREARAGVAALNRPGAPGPFDGLVDPPEEYMRLARRRGLSPTSLDVLAACPFQFYASRVLGLRLEDPAERGHLSPLARGKIYHRVLQRFHEDLKASGHWSRPPGAPWAPALERAAEEVFREHGWEALGVYPLLWEAARRQMLHHLREFAAWDVAEIRGAGLFPAFFERTMAAPADIRKSGAGEGIRFYGRPDRLDMDPAGKRFRVIDYKTRWTARESLRSRVLSMAAHQPPLYLEMARGASETADASPVGAYYYILEEPADGERGPAQEFSAEDWRAVRPSFLENLGRLAEQMAAGRFFIAPDEGRGGVCGRCAFAAACRKAHPPSRRRAEDSRLRSAYDEARRVQAAESTKPSRRKT